MDADAVRIEISTMSTHNAHIKASAPSVTLTDLHVRSDGLSVTLKAVLTARDLGTSGTKAALVESVFVERIYASSTALLSVGSL